ncbi:MAG: transcriptional regulator [Nitrososphaeraceae archaeon]|nr:transcriptional regulator [Nitrososphaeraceae archaeon]
MSTDVSKPKAPKNKSELAEQVFQAIVEGGDNGIFQTELCKSFSIDSRDGSRLVGNLEKQSLISREKILYKGRWTYKLIVKKIPHLKDEDKKPIEIDSVEGAPCFSCSYQHLCSTEDETSQYSPSKCVWIEQWVVSDSQKRGSDEIK